MSGHIAFFLLMVVLLAVPTCAVVKFDVAMVLVAVPFALLAALAGSIGGAADVSAVWGWPIGIVLAVGNIATAYHVARPLTSHLGEGK